MTRIERMREIVEQMQKFANRLYKTSRAREKVFWFRAIWHREIQELYDFYRATLTKGTRKTYKEVMTNDVAWFCNHKETTKCHPPYRCTGATAWKKLTLNGKVHGFLLPWFSTEPQLVCGGKENAVKENAGFMPAKSP